jgi:hypothetical protein
LKVLALDRLQVVRIGKRFYIAPAGKNKKLKIIWIPSFTTSFLDWGCSRGTTCNPVFPAACAGGAAENK